MLRNSTKTLLYAAALLGGTMMQATPAFAQATRTWVSGVGDDVNPCSRTAPCKTFAGAISKTAAGGEINCLDPAGYGAVTITKSLVIDCHYTEGGALAGGNGIVVNLPAATDAVTIRGLDIFGVNPPTNGIRMIGLGSLHVEDTVIRRFNASGSFGISYQPTGASQLYINNTTITENGSGATGGGILVQPTGTGTGKVSMRNVRIQNNANHGLRIDTTSTSTTAAVNVDVEDSTINGNANGVSVNTNTIDATVSIGNSQITNNTTVGIIASGSATNVMVGSSIITGNALGLSGAVLRTFGDNRVEANPNFLFPNNGTFTLAPTPKK